jgi:uncharacterized repeat protein (TIGR01451 family)
VRRTRVSTGVLLLGLGLLGIFLGAAAPERVPWPPPPVKPPPQAGAGAVPSALVSLPPAVTPGAIVPVQALAPVVEDGSHPPASKTSQANPPGIFPADVVPAQALASEAQPKPGENPPPPNFPEPKTTPLPTPPGTANGADGGGPMLGPNDEIKRPTAPSAPPPVNPPNVVTVPAAPPALPTVNPEPGPIPLPKLIEQHGLPLPENTSPPAAQPHVPPEPQRPTYVAVPIRRSHVAAPVTPPETPPATAKVVSKSTPARVAAPGFTLPSPLPSPLLTLEKRGPAELHLGQPVRFEIIVRNIGTMPATQVRIEDTLPEGVRFVGGSPHPVLEAGRVVWNLPQVLPSQEGKVYLELQATAAGDLTTQTILSHAMESRMQVRPAMLGMTVKGPERAAIGQPAVFEVQLTNVTDQPLGHLILKAQMSDGLTHLNGRNIESDDPIDLPPRGSKTVTLTITAVQPGRQNIEAAIITQGRQEAVAHADVFVGETSLVVHVPATARIVPGRISDLPIEVGNFDARPARNLVVTSKLPKGLEFNGASDQGVYRGGWVQWTIDYLAPGQTRFLHVRVKSRSPGDFIHTVDARAADGMKAQAEGHVLADGAARLNLTTAVKDNLLELGKETVFEIRLSNEGSSPDSNVQLQALLPEGMVPRSIEGMKYHLEGKEVIFEPIPRLEAKSQVMIQIGVLATTAGDRRLRVQVTSDHLRLPVTREERTFAYGGR